MKEIIGGVLYDLRMGEGFTREEFADLAEISLNAYSSIENGKSLIKIDTLNTLMENLSLSLSYFFELVEMKK